MDRAKGKFRAFLLAACTHFLANERDRERALKRGGDRHFFSIDCADADRCYRIEPVDQLTPEAVFQRRWAMTLLDQTFDELRAEMMEAGQGERFEVLKPTLTGDRVPHAHLAVRLNITVGAVHVAIHRLRERYREVLRARITATVDDPSQIDDEIRELFAAFSS